MMKGLIIMNAYPNGEKFYRQSRRLAEELKRAGAETEIRLNGGIEATIRTDGAADCIGGFDFAVYLDKDKYLGRMLELAGLRLFNCADAVEKCDDKMLTYRACRGEICVPKRSRRLCATARGRRGRGFPRARGERLGFPSSPKSFAPSERTFVSYPIWRRLRRRRRNFCMRLIFINDISPLRRAATSA
ncbi:MAG: hypothetical protein ACLRSW_16710 [Christensenellaceae bacterium]